MQTLKSVGSSLVNVLVPSTKQEDSKVFSINGEVTSYIDLDSSESDGSESQFYDILPILPFVLKRMVKSANSVCYRSYCAMYLRQIKSHTTVSTLKVSSRI